MGHLERQSRPPTDNNKTLVASSTNTTDAVAQDIHAQPPRPKTYGPIQFPTIGNKTDKKRSTRCLRDFISLGTQKFVVEGGGSRRRRVKCRIVSYNYFIRFLTRIPASLLA